MTAVSQKETPSKENPKTINCDIHVYLWHIINNKERSTIIVPSGLKMEETDLLRPPCADVAYAQVYKNAEATEKLELEFTLSQHQVL